MRICVVGAGAIGGLMGAKLALAGEDVTVRSAPIAHNADWRRDAESLSGGLFTPAYGSDPASVSDGTASPRCHRAHTVARQGEALRCQPIYNTTSSRM